MKATILSSFLYEMQVKHTTSFVEKIYWEHPYRNTLFGLYDMLKIYDIESVGVNVDDKCLDGVELPFIAHTGKNFAVVKKIESDEVLYWEDGKDIRISLNLFQSVWTGFALFAEKKASTKEPDEKKHLRDYWINRFTNYSPLLLLLLIVLMKYVRSFYSITFGGHLLLILNLSGMVIGAVLLNKQSYGLGKYTDKVCSLFKFGDCNSLLDSSVAKLWGIFSWSEVGFSFFLSTFVILVFFPSWGSCLALSNLLALPYTIWSIWYQYRIAKQWCPLCLSVLLLLWLMFVVHLFLGNLSFYNFSIEKFFFLGVFYLFVFLSLHLVVTRNVELKQLEYDKYELNRFKRLEDVFLSQLKQSTFYALNEKSSSILFGNPKAKFRITILTNPYCGPCAQMHERVGRLLRKFDEKVCIQYIFSSFSEELEIGARLLIAVYMEKKEEEVMSIYDEWFAGKKYLGKEYLDMLKINIDSEAIFQELELHNTWRRKNGLTVTPTIMVNGYLLPESYKIEDLEYFVDIDCAI